MVRCGRHSSIGTSGRKFVESWGGVMTSKNCQKQSGFFPLCLLSRQRMGCSRKGRGIPKIIWASSQKTESLAEKQWAVKLLEQERLRFVWILEGRRSDAWSTGSREEAQGMWPGRKEGEEWKAQSLTELKVNTFV